jgi:hypothetical protein
VTIRLSSRIPSNHSRACVNPSTLPDLTIAYSQRNGGVSTQITFVSPGCAGRGTIFCVYPVACFAAIIVSRYSAHLFQG